MGGRAARWLLVSGYRIYREKKFMALMCDSGIYRLLLGDFFSRWEGVVPRGIEWDFVLSYLIIMPLGGCGARIEQSVLFRLPTRLG